MPRDRGRQIDMTITSHHSTVEISSIVLQLRHDLSVSLREFGGQSVCVLEDEINSRFFRIGRAEYTFLSVLDGHATFADALGRTATLMKDEALSESEAAAFCRWLIENRLATTPQSASSARLFEANQQVRRRKRSALMNPMFVRIPLLNPDAAFTTLSVLFGWLLSWPAFLLWLLVMSGGLIAVGMNWAEAVQGTSMIVADSNGLWLLATWLLLKLVHETAHGIASRRFGGTVREAGVLLLLFVPLPYVDVTSAWRCDSKWHRIIVSAAGMYAELFVAAVAACVWSQTHPGMLHQHAFHLMLSGSLMSLVFNANPLMRFDGYYILTDLLELPNLASHGQQSLRRIGRRIFFGLETSIQNWPEGRSRTFLVYGLLAFAWRILVCVGLVLAADALYFGAGVILAAIAVVMWILIPAARFAKFAMLGSNTEQPHRVRFAVVMSCLILPGYLAWTYVPWYSRFAAPAVVDFASLMHVRTSVSGFVDAVEVDCGEYVHEGQVLIALRNPELESRRTELLKHLEITQQRIRQYFDQQQVAAWQVEQDNRRALTRQLSELDDQRRQLKITSPISGVVVDATATHLRDTYVQPGDLLMTIGDAEQKQITTLISPEIADSFAARFGHEVTVHIRGTGLQVMSGTLCPASPRASTQIIHPAFSAVAGGPLPVVPDDTVGPNGPHFRFTEPMLQARLRVDQELLKPFRAGRVATVSFRSSMGTIGEVAMKNSQRWLKDHQVALRESWAY